MVDVRSEDIARRLGEHMKTWREVNDLTLEKAAHRMGADLQAWQRWEQGGNPTLKTMLRIAATMETDLPTLMADLFWPKDE